MLEKRRISFYHLKQFSTTSKIFNFTYVNCCTILLACDRLRNWFNQNNKRNKNCITITTEMLYITAVGTVYKIFVSVQFIMELFKKIFSFPFIKTHSQNGNVIEENNKGEIVNKINLTNSNDESSNSDNLNNEIDYNILSRDQLIFINQTYGLCSECNQPNTEENWCKECYSKKFRQNFGNWTSGNENIDKFIQESQLNARFKYELLEWIPYNRLRNIKFLAQGGFSTVYEAIWLDGLIKNWDYKKQSWNRIISDKQDYKDANNPQIKNPLKNNEKHGLLVALKSLNDSSNINEDFLSEVSSYIY